MPFFGRASRKIRSTHFPSSNIYKMNSALKYPCKRPFVSDHFKLPKATSIIKGQANYTNSTASYSRRELSVKACGPSNGGGEKKTARRGFLSLEEAGLVEVSGLSSHERFLCRLTISSLNLLKVISEQEGCSIEELNAGRVCDWFLKDKLKREQDLESAVLQWDDDPDFQF